MTITVHDPVYPVDPGKKWNGKSTHQLRTKIENAREIGRALYIVQQQMEAARKVLDAEVSAELVRILDRPDVTDPQFIALSVSWECADSPTGNCIYYTEDDPMKDFCLFCDNPLDRG
jgi:hypothetical protein